MNITEEFVKENKDKKFTVTLEDGRIFKNIKFFISTNGCICYHVRNQKRYGYHFPCYDKIKNITEHLPKVYNNVSNAKTILKKIHPNAWNNIKEEMKKVIDGESVQDFEWHFTGKLKFRNVSSLLSDYERKRLKESFENKISFGWHQNTHHHSGRDLSISVEIGEDNELRAYFSSEFMGCGNGDYWLLLNPTTAIYYERD